MTGVQLVMWIAFWVGFGWATGKYVFRFFPKYRRGTHVVVRYEEIPEYPVHVKYLYHSTIGYHKVEVLPGDLIWPDGRVLTVKTSDLKEGVEAYE